AFIGIKMILAGPWMHLYEVPVLISLAIVVGIIGIGVIASMAAPRGKKPELKIEPGEGCPCGHPEKHESDCAPNKLDEKE
ncbi:MAG: hypothetical protein Q7J68_02465, partial [Thermoplasmata archaeon]|nr:hypothetical protein [Thermoplasmata archaeon]